MGEGNFLKEVSFPHTPILQELSNSGFIFLSLFLLFSVCEANISSRRHIELRSNISTIPQGIDIDFVGVGAHDDPYKRVQF